MQSAGGAILFWGALFAKLLLTANMFYSARTTRANKKKWLLGGGGKQAKLEVPEVKRGQESYGAEAGPGILFYLSLRTPALIRDHIVRGAYPYGYQPKEVQRLIEMLRPSIFRAPLEMTS